MSDDLPLTLPQKRAGLLGLKRTLRPLFNLIALAFIFYAAHSLYSRWDASPVAFDLWLFLGGCVLAAVAMILQLLAFRSLLTRWVGKTPSFWGLGRLYLDSQMARYTPGKIGLVAVRVAGARKVGLDARVMGAALGVEMLSWCAAGTLVGLALTFAVTQEELLLRFSSSLGVLAVLLASAGVMTLTLLPRRRLPVRLESLIPSEHSGPIVPPGLFFFHLLHFTAWVGCGAVLAVALGASNQTALFAGALLPLSIVLGFLALLAPAGVGVREAILSAALAPSMGPSGALALSLLCRTASLSTDVLLWLCFRLIKRG